MAIVAGIDFGTLSLRVSIVDSERGPIGSAIAAYDLKRSDKDPKFATQRHEDHLTALTEGMREALEKAGVAGAEIAAIALATTGSSVIPVGADMQPLGDYYLWCDHRAHAEAAEITSHARLKGFKGIDWCGGIYSSEWGFSKLLHWLRHNPEQRQSFASAFEHCDYIAAVLCGVSDPSQAARSVCAMGHKWMWNESLGGLPPEEFLVGVDPLLAEVRVKLNGRYATSDQLAGRLSVSWAKRLGLSPGIPIPVGAFDAHWDAVGAFIREGDVVNVVGTSTCIIAIAKEVSLIPGVCGLVKGSVHPDYFGIEAGLSATGDIFQAIAQRAGKSVAELSNGLEDYRGGQTGLLRMSWDNGDRSILVNSELSGVTLGWTLGSSARDEMFAAIEGTAFHTRIILERLAEYGVPIQRVIHGGGIPQKNEVLNQVYANVLNKPVLVPAGDVTSLGSAIFAFLAAATFGSIEEAQDRLCPRLRSVWPETKAAAIYERLYGLYRKLYFAMGARESGAVSIGDVLPQLRAIAAEVRVER